MQHKVWPWPTFDLDLISTFCHLFKLVKLLQLECLLYSETCEIRTLSGSKLQFSMLTAPQIEDSAEFKGHFWLVPMVSLFHRFYCYLRK
jgi:hypothetical protein